MVLLTKTRTLEVLLQSILINAYYISVSSPKEPLGLDHSGIEEQSDYSLSEACSSIYTHTHT